MPDWSTPEGQPANRPVHSYPLEDLHEHVFDGDPCPCMPREVDGVVVHNSYDGRECGEVLLKLVRVISEIAPDNHTWSDRQKQSVEHAEAIVALHWPKLL